MSRSYLQQTLAAVASAAVLTFASPDGAPAAPVAPAASADIVAVGVGTLSTTPGGDLSDALSSLLRRLARALTLRRS